MNLVVLGSIIQMHADRHGRLPAALEELTELPTQSEGRLDLPPRDPWGRPFEYKFIGTTEFTLRSYGEDGERDTDDDVIYEPR